MTQKNDKGLVAKNTWIKSTVWCVIYNFYWDFCLRSQTSNNKTLPPWLRCKKILNLDSVIVTVTRIIVEDTEFKVESSSYLPVIFQNKTPYLLK